MAALIEIENLSRKFGDRLAVADLTLSVEAGEIFGFVGPNGAGKTSTIRMIAHLLRPTSGHIRVGGFPVDRDPRQALRLLGYMPDFFGVYPEMKVWEYLDFFAAAYGIAEPARPRLIAELLELVDLRHRRDDWVEKLSRGMKQRLSLARALVHDPQALILDEPASGLDPRARVEIRELMLELARLGKTIFFSTHILADVAEVCSRVGIIEAGRLVAVGSLEELHRQLLPRQALPGEALAGASLAARRIELTLLGPAGPARQALSGYPGVLRIENSDRQEDERSRLEFEFSGDDEALSRLVAALAGQGLPLIQFGESLSDLESIFLRATRGGVS